MNRTLTPQEAGEIALEAWKYSRRVLELCEEKNNLQSRLSKAEEDLRETERAIEEERKKATRRLNRTLDADWKLKEAVETIEGLLSDFGRIDKQMIAGALEGLLSTLKDEEETDDE